MATIHLAGRHDARHLHRPESTSGPIRNHRLVGNKSFSITGERTEMPVVRAAGGGIGIVRKGGGDSGGPKRKPLPKIYGCDVCGKKFDRPSTLKVVSLPASLAVLKHVLTTLVSLSLSTTPSPNPTPIHTSMKPSILAPKVGPIGVLFYLFPLSLDPLFSFSSVYVLSGPRCRWFKG